MRANAGWGGCRTQSNQSVGKLTESTAGKYIWPYDKTKLLDRDQVAPQENTSLIGKRTRLMEKTGTGCGGVAKATFKLKQ